MTYYDVFNGDADGICALQQLRLAEPVESRLITGVKRDIALLKQVDAGSGDEITVLDVSLDKNRADLERVLGQGARVSYFDHHYAGEVPEHGRLMATIEPTPDVGTSLLVDRHLEGRYRAWAVVGTFGDNFDETALRVAEPLGLKADRLEELRELGIYLNYNGYGATVGDLHFAPDELYRRLHPYLDPLDFIAGEDTFNHLRDGYGEDVSLAEGIQPEIMQEKSALYIFPADAWARRVSGVFANRLAQEAPARAHALLTQLPDGGFVVSVRAPLTTKSGADELCRQFPTGGGRKAAAGINNLPESQLDEFSRKFVKAF
ncbi:MAG: acetyltransferase [Gammaproteobacteria bacterium]|nr:acetyltransferase [Gammaproteobacteria bacterium]